MEAIWDRVVRGACFLAGGVLCATLSIVDLWQCCASYLRLKVTQTHPLSEALPLSYLPARVTRGALVAHRHSFASPLCRTSQHNICAPLNVSWNDLGDPIFDGLGLVGFKSRTNAFLLA